MSILAKFEPIPNTCGLIETRTESAAECVIAQLEAGNRQNMKLLGTQHDSGTTFRCTQINSDLERALESLVPLTVGITTRHLLVPTTHENWIAYFNNCKMPGSDTNLIRILSTQLKVNAVLAIRQDETITKISNKEWRGFFGAYIFRIYNGKMTPERAVEVAHYEDGWTFEQIGVPCRFEHVERYSAQRKRDRFDGPLLTEYLAAMGLHPYSDNFYPIGVEHPAYLIERIDADETIRQRIRFFSLEEAQFSRFD